MKIMRGYVKLTEIVALSLKNSQTIFTLLLNFALYLHHFLLTKGLKQVKNRNFH